LGQRSRKRGQRTKPPAPVATATAPPRNRSEERNAAVRARLTPLAPGERPWPLLVSALLALVLVIANLVLLIGDIKLRGAKPGSEIVYLALMSMCAYGLFRARYWAVLGFMVLLLLTMLEAGVLLLRASNVAGVAITAVLLFGGGYLFYKLVRVLSRIQMPEPPGR
jgi:uncharacterized membrane protein